MDSKNEIFSKLCTYTGITSLCTTVNNRIRKNSVRVINYHDIPLAQLDKFSKQIDIITDQLNPITPEEFIAVIQEDHIPSKPSVIFTFDDGFVSHASYVASKLTEKGISGWFFVPTEAPTIPNNLQAQWAIDHQVLKPNESASIGGRTFANWDDWRRVKNHHVIASHTHSHKRFGPSISEDDALDELNTSFAILQSELGISEKYFCWVGGEKTSYGQPASEAVRKAQTTLAFTTCSLPVKTGANSHRIERTNIESHFSDCRVKLAISGIVDFKYYSKRKSLNHIFSDSASD